MMQINFAGLRLLGIGRNEYIDLMNHCRSGRKLFRRKNVRDLLPAKPVDINIEPWWLVAAGCIIEEDIKVTNCLHFCSYNSLSNAIINKADV